MGSINIIFDVHYLDLCSILKEPLQYSENPLEVLNNEGPPVPINLDLVQSNENPVENQNSENPELPVDNQNPVEIVHSNPAQIDDNGNMQNPVDIPQSLNT